MVFLQCPFLDVALSLCSFFSHRRSYFISPNHPSSRSLNFSLINFFLHGASSVDSYRLSQIPIPAWHIVPSVFLLSGSEGPPGGVRVFFSHSTLPLQTSSRTVLYSGFSARELHPSVGTRRLLETKLWFSICRQFSFSPTEPHFALLSRTNKVHHISLSHVYSQSPVGHAAYSVSLYLFPVIIFHLSLFPKNKFFTEATPTRLFLTLELCGPFTYTIYALLV